MNLNSLATGIIAGVVTLALIVGMVVLAAAGQEVPDAMSQALPYALGGALGVAALAKPA